MESETGMRMMEWKDLILFQIFPETNSRMTMAM